MTRYELRADSDMVPCKDGDYVTFYDHETEVDRLRGNVKDVLGHNNDLIKQVDRLRAALVNAREPMQRVINYDDNTATIRTVREAVEIIDAALEVT